MLDSLRLSGGRELVFDRPHIMGILNATPDSFSDGGRFTNVENALKHAEQMVLNGATILDIGGESTRPGALPVSVEEELARVCPLVEKITSSLDVVVSVDTSSPEVMRESVSVGAHMINDVRALSRDGAEQTVLELNVPVCLMHMQGHPALMQVEPTYERVVDEVFSFLQSRIDALTAQGFDRSQIIIDPGFGFGKTLEHNQCLFRALDRFLDLEVPLLVGVSRKTMIGAITRRDIADRMVGSVVAAALANLKGANILRVHDVSETRDALKIVNALM